MVLPVAREFDSDNMLAALAELFVRRGPPAHVMPENDPDRTATAVQK